MTTKGQALLDAEAALVTVSDEEGIVERVVALTGEQSARVLFDPSAPEHFP